MSTTKNDVLEELKHHHLTKVIGRKPNHHDVDKWEEEASTIATLITTGLFERGGELGHLACVVSEAEYRLEIDDADEEWEYIEPTDPGPYNNEITGDEEEHVIKRMEAEHKQKQIDYQKYLGVQEHLRREFTSCMDPTWITALRRNRSGFANVTIHQFLAHLRANVAKLTSKQKNEMRDQLKIEWDQSKDIQEFFTEMEEKQIKIESWGAATNMDEEALQWATSQMIDSGLFDERFLRKWEKKPENEKTWAAMKAYFKEEYDDIKMFGDPTNRRMETINSTTEGADVSELLEEIRRDAMVGNEQIQQMATSFKGATDTISEVMDRLKTALDQVKVLTATNKTLVETNKQLADTIKTLGGKATTKTPEKEDRPPVPSIKESNPNGEVCPICDKVHQKPFKDYCWALAKNAHLIPKRGRRGTGN